MTTDIVEVNNFIVLIEQSNADQPIVQTCAIDGDAVGFAFYGSGEVKLEIKHQNQTKIVTNTKGIAISFFGNSKVEFSHKIGPNRPLQSVSIFSKLNNLHILPQEEQEIFSDFLPELLNPIADFVEGPRFYMTPYMQNAVHKIMTTTYKGNTRQMFLKSQVNELLSHFFAFLASDKKESISNEDKGKLFKAKEIMESNISSPPSLSELSKLIGLNNSKLKKNFKELFGIPVFKFLQEERLNRAYEMLSNTGENVQEVAWHVGYDSLSSFSNAFRQKFGVRPNEIKQQFFLNKS
ncbi:helix-turn-helix domain-containing protein [Sphingobacterium sp. SGR-19]|uniref:helix-turn-helix domain-containing protein n=1 Tax=Sphingobacterium sp. SGR-19 TaxID=2710886 RepID=UPI0013EBD3E4|nr:helix-turn-helix domain-containing protein [Sphingobacterium sp. SGR-19]NGM66817.1 helix-turn-helix transcriptional regulator [Sphingobacterium sp. SGR-19]